MAHKIRIYQNIEITSQKIIPLDERNNHYCINVMRCKLNDEILIFNGYTEWLATIVTINKKNSLICPQKNTNRKIFKTGIVLFLGISKEKTMKTSVRQATELGVDKINFVIMDYTNNKTIDNYFLQTIEACEQSERINIPVLEKPIKFIDLIKTESFKTSKVIICNEKIQQNNTTHDTEKLLSNISKQNMEQIGVFIGPEGGFSKNEINELINLQNIYQISLGPNILKVDTAVVAGISFVNYKIKNFCSIAPNRV